MSAPGTADAVAIPASTPSVLDATARATPKSSSLTPDFVIMMLAGFTSRWIDAGAMRNIERAS